MRCFVAIELPEHIRDRLAELQQQLTPLAREIRWTRPEQIHLTLKFLGEMPDDRVAELCAVVVAAAGGLGPIPLEVSGLGCFPPRGGARVVWAGLEDPSSELARCHDACEEAFAKVGFPPETRPFSPHLTIGRSRDPRGSRQARGTLDGLATFAAGSFTATKLTLFESILGRSGATYNALVHAHLSGAGTA